MTTDARVGPYRIIRLVNRGGQGSVYLGYDKRLHRRVAIKIYAMPPSRGERKQLLREARLIASMHSPKVVQIHDVIESSEHLAMVMEYVPGCDLEDFLSRVRPSLASVLAIAADIAGGLAVARQQHIVHGDLKAANVLIAESGRVKLTDFGIASGPAQGTGGHYGGGSLSALSPEQCLGKPTDARSDLFALGCLLYRMLSGVQPFFRNGQLDQKMLLELPPRPLQELVSADVNLPPELIELVVALLQKNPQDRPSNTRVVRQVLRRVARDIPLTASNGLLEEARPCFRTDSADDIPPDIPAGLGREGRSRLVGAEPGGLRTWREVGWFSWRIPVLAALILGIGIVVSVAYQARETRVHIEAPQLRLVTGTRLPGEISGRWLVAEVARVVAERLGPLQITGPIGATPVTTLNTDIGQPEDQGPADEQLQLGLRCIEQMCVFAVSRNWRGQQANQQAVLFPDMSPEQWRDIVRSTTRALYP